MSRFGDYTIDPNFEAPVAKTPPTEPATPPDRPKRELADMIERATVVEIRPGDVLVFETDCRMCDDEVEAFRSNVREAVSRDVEVILVERGRFAGVIRDRSVSEDDDPHAGQTCGFRWRDEFNAASGSEHQCAEPVHPNFTDEHRCRCEATRPGVVVLGAAIGRDEP